ncbi:MAG TPA: deoxyribose-phosphate aldolase [Bacteroidetes bacterium]|nr:deoxyribose-phosphate aldolase [Bacteroidota bacterium]HEX05549.1 deoxyribose-phosphate aldolase [Bacteroidota bacterium]
MTLGELAARFDHTILNPGAGRTDIARVCSEARIWKTAAVCVHPIWVKDARVELVESGVPVCTVIGFPHGATAYPALEAETVRALEDGASEFDMMIPYGIARSEGWSYVEDNVRAVRESAGSHILKVILETSELSDPDIRDAANAAINGGADYLKTSTGFASGGATEASVRLLAEIGGTRANVKASGGINSYSKTMTMLRAGATRIGTSATVAILEEARQHLKR